MVMFSIGDGMAGKVKDTHRNLKSNPECVISLAGVDQAKDMQNSSEDLPAIWTFLAFCSPTVLSQA